MTHAIIISNCRKRPTADSRVTAIEKYLTTKNVKIIKRLERHLLESNCYIKLNIGRQVILPAHVTTSYQEVDLL